MNITENELLQELIDALQLEAVETPISEGFTRGDLERMGYTEGQSRRMIRKMLRNAIIEAHPDRVYRQTVHGILTGLMGYRFKQKATG